MGKEKHTRNENANENYLKKKSKQKGGKEIKLKMARIGLQYSKLHFSYSNTLNNELLGLDSAL